MMKENNDSGKSHFISKRDNNSINNQKLINKTNEMLLICIKNHLILYLICFCLIIFIYFYSINSIFKTSFLNLRELQENKTYSEIIVIIEGNQDYINISYHNSASANAGANRLYISSCYGKGIVKVLPIGTSTVKTQCFVSNCRFETITKDEPVSGVDNMELIKWNNIETLNS